MDVGRDERQILCVLKTREKHHYYFETALKPRNVAKLSRNCLSFYETLMNEILPVFRLSFSNFRNF